MADYDIFREQLAIKYPSYGHALWDPSPKNPNKPVQVGDVGFVREGRFYRIFSALLPADHPSQEFGVPEYHEPLVPTLSDHLGTGSLHRNNYCSAGIKVEVDPGYNSSPDDFRQVLFRNETTRRAAALSLPVTARRENTLIRNAFGQWMVKHIDTWFAFARNLGLVHQMEEIILVTGCDLTKSWTNIAFLGGWDDAQVSFGTNVEGPNPSINFQFQPEQARGAVLRHGPEGANLPENQCVFIRGFRVAPSLWILPKRLKAAAGPSPDPDSDSDMEVISIPAITQFRDPLHLLSDYIAEQAPDCDKILVHDDDLLMIDGIGHGTSPVTLEPDVMADLLGKSDIKIHTFGCDSFLTESQCGPNTDTSTVKVATLSTTFQNWNSTPPSQWSPPAAQMIDLGHTSDLRGTPQPTIPGNSPVPTFQRVSTKPKFSLLPEHDDSAPSTLQDLSYCAPPDRGQSAGHNYHEVSSGTGDPCDSSSYMNAMSAESGPGLRSTYYPESAGSHGQDVDPFSLMTNSVPPPARRRPPRISLASRYAFAVLPPPPTIPSNLSVPTFPRWSNERKFSLLPEHDDSAPSTSQDLVRDCSPLERGQPAGRNYHDALVSPLSAASPGLHTIVNPRVRVPARRNSSGPFRSRPFSLLFARPRKPPTPTVHPTGPSYPRPVSTGTRDPCNSSSYINSTLGAESGPGLWSTHYSESAGGHGQDVNSTGVPLIAYTDATPRGSSFDSSSNLVDRGDGSSTLFYQPDPLHFPRRMPSGNHASEVFAMKRADHDTGDRRCPVCHDPFRHPHELKWHIISHLPSWLYCPNGDCAWRGRDWGDLYKHLHDKHPSSKGEKHASSELEADGNTSMIYDPWPLVEGITKGEITFEIATQQALSSINRRAVEVGKMELWEGNSGVGHDNGFSLFSVFCFYFLPFIFVFLFYFVFRTWAFYVGLLV